MKLQWNEWGFFFHFVWSTFSPGDPRAVPRSFVSFEARSLEVLSAGPGTSAGSLLYSVKAPSECCAVKGFEPLQMMHEAAWRVTGGVGALKRPSERTFPCSHPLSVLCLSSLNGGPAQLHVSSSKPFFLPSVCSQPHFCYVDSYLPRAHTS